MKRTVPEGDELLGENARLEVLRMWPVLNRFPLVRSFVSQTNRRLGG